MKSQWEGVFSDLLAPGGSYRRSAAETLLVIDAPEHMLSKSLASLEDDDACWLEYAARDANPEVLKRLLTHRNRKVAGSVAIGMCESRTKNPVPGSLTISVYGYSKPDLPQINRAM